MKQVTYTGNNLAREVPTMPEWLHPVQTFPVLPGHNWIIGQTYEEGRDYKVLHQIQGAVTGTWITIYLNYWLSVADSRKRAVLQPIVKGEQAEENLTAECMALSESSLKETWDNEKDEKWSKELDTAVEDGAPVSISTTEFITKAKSLLKKIYDGYGKYHKKKFDDNEESTCSTCGGFLYVERGGVGDVDCPSCNGTGQDLSCIFDSEGFSEFIEHTIMFGGEPFLELLECNVKSGEAKKVFQIKELPEVGELDKKINICVYNELHNQHYKEIQYKFWAAIEAIEKHYRGVNDVASDSKASPSLASHSSTEGNSIEQFIKMKINAAHRNWDKAQKTSQKRWYAGRLKAFHEVLEFLNTEQNPERSVATPDPSSNED